MYVVVITEVCNSGPQSMDGEGIFLTEQSTVEDDLLSPIFSPLFLTV